MLVKNSKDYTAEVRQIVEMGDLWGAIKCDGNVEVTEVNDSPAFALDGKIFIVRNMSWNDMQTLARVDPTTHKAYDEPLFETVVEPSDVKFGSFEEVHKRGYVLFPLEAYHDMKHRPIAIRKA